MRRNKAMTRAEVDKITSYFGGGNGDLAGANLKGANLFGTRVTTQQLKVAIR